MRHQERNFEARRGASTVIARLSTALLILCCPMAAQAVTIFTPSPFSAIQADHISIVGVSQNDTATLNQPGRPPVSVPVIDGWFHIRAELKFGFNELYISTEAGDTVWLATVRLPFMATMRRTKVRYPKYTFHGNEIGRVCIECHDLAPFSGEGQVMPDSTCQSCHLPKREWTAPHRPAAESECRICHGEGVLPIPSPLDNKSLCQSCHRGKIEQFDKQFVHGPVGAGSCLACHDPHGSEVEFSLRRPVQTLCASCHEDTDEGAEGKLLHAPFRDGACTTCHDPHATNYAWGQSRKSNAICTPCHIMDQDNNWHSHPTTGRLKSVDQKLVTVNAEGELECTSCHDPHFSDASRLLRTSDEHACRGCHDDK